MNIPENIAIVVGITLIISLLANAAFIGLAVAYINTDQNRRWGEATDRFKKAEDRFDRARSKKDKE